MPSSSIYILFILYLSVSYFGEAILPFSRESAEEALKANIPKHCGYSWSQHSPQQLQNEEYEDPLSFGDNSFDNNNKWSSDILVRGHRPHPSELLSYHNVPHMFTMVNPALPSGKTS